MEKMSDFFASIKMTIVAGIFLAISLLFMLTGTDMPVDP